MKNFYAILILFIVAWSTPAIADDNQVCFEWKQRQYLGCYEDNEQNRMFRGYLVFLRENNTIETCANICLEHRFVYAGVQDSLS